MKLEKVKEILELNIKEAGKQMPPDVKTALEIAIEAIKAVQKSRDSQGLWLLERLPGETNDNGGS